MFSILSNSRLNHFCSASIYLARRSRYSIFSSAEYSRLWDASTVGDRTIWSRPVPDAALSLLRSRMFPSSYSSSQIEQSLNDILNSFEISEGWRALKKEREDLSNRGFVLLQLPPDLSDSDQKRLFWYLCQQLGKPLQNTLHEFNDGEKIFSLPLRMKTGFKTNHNGGPTKNYDYVAFLCASSDHSTRAIYQLISGYTVFSHLSKSARAVLGQSVFKFMNAGTNEAALLPVFQVKEDGGLTIRYSQEWLDLHREKAPKLDDDQQKALQELEEVLARDRLRLEFRLNRGDMLIINNRWVLNNSLDLNAVGLESFETR